MTREKWVNVRTQAMPEAELPFRVVAERREQKAQATAPWQEEMLHIFARNQLRVALFMPALVVFFALANLAWVSAFIVVAWLVAYLLLETHRLLLARQYLAHHSRPPSRDDTANWLRTFTINELLHAGLWLAPLVMFWQPGEILQHVFIGGSIMATLVIRLLVANSFLPLVMVGNGLVLIGLSVRAALSNSIADMAMAGMVLLLGLFFFQIARRLQNSMREMLEYRRQREQLIEELARQRDAAERARRQAEEANRAKSQFLAAMSHELRTPLNAIMGFSEIISTEMLGPLKVDRYKEYANDIHRSGNYLLNLIEDILDLSRIEAGRVEMKEEVVDVVAEAETAINLLSMKAEARKQKLLLVAEDSVELLGNTRYIRQMWVNLVSNAIKFTPQGGEITLAVRRLKGGNLALEVRDTGEGIPEHELHKVMQSFSRGASATRKAVDGAGLGLAIVNGLARLHDARLELESKVGKGTTARIVFPARRVISGARAELMRGEVAEDDLEHQLLLLTA